MSAYHAMMVKLHYDSFKDLSELDSTSSSTNEMTKYNTTTAMGGQMNLPPSMKPPPLEGYKYSTVDWGY